MSKIELPGIIINIDKGICYIREGIHINIIDTGFVNSLLERIMYMTRDETIEYLKDISLPVIRRMLG